MTTNKTNTSTYNNTNNPSPTKGDTNNSNPQTDMPLADSLRQLESRIEKIREAENFLEDISGRLYWALDFSQCREATEPISNILDAVSNSQSKLQESCDNLETILEEFQEKHKELSNCLNKELNEALQAI